MLKRLHYQRLMVLAGLLFAGCANEQAEPGDYADSMAQQHAGDVPRSNVDTLQSTLPVTGGPVTYGDSYSGYEVYPEPADTAAAPQAALPALILVHEWWGLNDNMRAMARQLAGEGYRVLAVDLFGGIVAEDAETAQGLVRQAMQDETAALENLAAAHTHLETQRGATRVGVMGFCFGGGMALNAALAMPDDVDAAVIYYGRITTDRGMLERLDMPVLGIFGGADESIPVDRVREFEQTLIDLENPAEIHVFEGAGHAFANPSGTTYQPEAASRAWRLTTDFLAQNLKG